MGQYFRSNMDWDWDLRTCIRRLFKVQKQTRAGLSIAMQIPPDSSPLIHVGTTPEDMWKISAGHSHREQPKEVQMVYKIENGEAWNMLFAPAFSSPGCQEVLYSTMAQRTGGTQESEENSTSSSGAS